LSVLTLFSYYWNLCWTQIFVPIRDYKDYLFEPAKFNIVYIERNGKVLEYIAFSVIYICCNFLPIIVNVLYLRLYQLNSYIEYTRSTTVLDIYYYIRISRLYSYQETARDIYKLLGFTIEIPNKKVSGKKADNKRVNIGKAAEKQTVFKKEDDG